MTHDPADATSAEAADAAPIGFDPARAVRAIRRRCVLSQRELALRAGVAYRTVVAIESGRRNPGIAVLSRIATATGLHLAVVDAFGVEVAADDAHDAIRDRGGRRFPAHLAWDGRPVYLGSGREWWGWEHLRWHDSSDPVIPDHVYWHRRRPPREGEWRDHPWYGRYQARPGGRRHRQSRGPSDGPPEPPPA